MIMYWKKQNSVPFIIIIELQVFVLIVVKCFLSFNDTVRFIYWLLVFWHMYWDEYTAGQKFTTFYFSSFSRILSDRNLIQEVI